MGIETILAITAIAATTAGTVSAVQQKKAADKERKKQEDLNKQRQGELDAEEAKRKGEAKRAETAGQRVGFGFRGMFTSRGAASTGFGGNEDKPITRGTLFGN